MAAYSMHSNTTDLGKHLGTTGEEPSTNFKQKAFEYSTLVLGLVFLHYADWKFTKADQELKNQDSEQNTIGKIKYQEKGVLYLQEPARFSKLLELSEDQDIGRAINEAMKAIEVENNQLNGLLPKTYHLLDPKIIKKLLENIAFLPDIHVNFSIVYAYLLNLPSLAWRWETESLFTPISIVEKMIKEIKDLQMHDSSCGTASFLQETIAYSSQQPSLDDVSVEIRQGFADILNFKSDNPPFNYLFRAAYHGILLYDTFQDSLMLADYVICNPPFNIRNVDKKRFEKDSRFPFGIPKADNANYLFAQIVYSTLKTNGKAALLMPDTASDADGSELIIRRKLIQTGALEAIISLGLINFSIAKVSCAIWLFNKEKADVTLEEAKILFVDARHIHQQANHKSISFTPEQLELIISIIQLHKGILGQEKISDSNVLKHYFPDRIYQDIPGLCRASKIDEIESHNWSLRPELYVRKVSTKGFKHHSQKDAINNTLNTLDIKGKIIKQNEISEIDAKIQEVELIIEQTYMDWFIKPYFKENYCEALVLDLDQVCMPDKWKAVELRELSSIKISPGIKPKYDDTSPKNVINQKCIRYGQINFALARKHSTEHVSEKKILKFGDILVNSLGVGTLGRVAQVYEEIENCTVDSHICIIRPKPSEIIEYLGITMLRLQKHYSRLGVGSTGQQRLRSNDIASTKILLPPHNIIKNFNETIVSLRRELFHLYKIKFSQSISEDK